MNKNRNKKLVVMSLICMLIMITCMYCNLLLCCRVLNTLDKLLIDYPVVVTTEKVVMVKSEDVIATEVEEIEEAVEEIEIIEEEIKEDIEATPTPAPQAQSGVLTKSKGTVQFDGHKETYYNLPMNKVVSNAQKKGIEGEYWEREDGAKMLGDYIMVAADQRIHPYGSLVETSLGTGVVVDTGTFIMTNPQQIDIAVNW